MSLLSRVLRNLARSKARTIGVALLVGVSLAIFLILSQLVSGIESNEQSALASLENVVTVTPANSTGFYGGFGAGGSAHITNPNIVTEVQASSSDIVSVQRIVLGSSIPPGSFGGGGGGGGFGGGGGGFNFANFSTYEGIDTSSPIVIFGGFGGASAPSVPSGDGRLLDAQDENTHNAMIGSTYASNNNLVVGSAVDVNGTYFTVVGIYSQAAHGPNTIIIPYPAALNALNVPGASLVYVAVNNPSNVDTVVSALSSSLGAYYTVTAPAQNAGSGFDSALDSTVNDASFGEYTALAVGAAVMILVMVLVTLQRTREIGVLKALGFGNGPILTQLLTESIFLALLGLPIGIVVAIWLGPSVNNLIFGASSTTSGGASGFGGGHAAYLAGGRFGEVSFNLTPETVLLGILVTVGFGLIGAAYPILRALRLKPTEALRHE